MLVGVVVGSVLGVSALTVLVVLMLLAVRHHRSESLVLDVLQMSLLFKNRDPAVSLLFKDFSPTTQGM